MRLKCLFSYHVPGTCIGNATFLYTFPEHDKIFLVQ